MESTPETGLNRLKDGPLTIFGIYTLQLTFGQQMYASVLRNWGFNHLGGWSFCEEKIGLPYIANLDLGRMSEALWFDAFDPELPARVMDWAERLTARIVSADCVSVTFPTMKSDGGMRRFLNSIFLKDGRIIRSSCFGIFSTTAMRGTGRSYCEIGCHREKLTASNPFVMLAPRSRYAPTGPP